MKGIYDVKDEKLIEYAQKVDIVREKFTEITFEQIPRKENEKTDTLAKMAGTIGSCKTRNVEEEEWRTVITDYLKEGKLPDNPRVARKLRIKCSCYVIVEEVLYQRYFAGPLLRCLSYQEADYVLQEVHEGCCGNHLGAYALAKESIARRLFLDLSVA
ncbi:uncharacterized protein [Primulina eburnea]|uniref:uncharacterized protein n=1 Tax=Primulina eburnea TaxID=1245227 RepID=UPI003C6C3041